MHLISNYGFFKGREQCSQIRLGLILVSQLVRVDGKHVSQTPQLLIPIVTSPTWKPARLIYLRLVVVTTSLVLHCNHLLWKTYQPVIVKYCQTGCKPKPPLLKSNNPNLIWSQSQLLLNRTSQECSTTRHKHKPTRWLKQQTSQEMCSTSRNSFPYLWIVNYKITSHIRRVGMQNASLCPPDSIRWILWI